MNGESGSDSERLRALQEADAKLASLTRRHYALLQARERNQKLRVRAEGMARERLHRYRIENERLSDLSWELDDLEQRLRELREQRPGSGDVLLDREVQSLARRHEQLEEYVLEQMLRTDELGRSTPADQQQIERLNRRIATREERLARLIARLEHSIASYDAARAHLAGALPAALLARYESLRASSGDRPLARLVGGRCAACGALVHAESREAALPLCPSCGHILTF